MPLPADVQSTIYEYCNSHLADETWYEGEFEFIQDKQLQKRIIDEFRAIRFAYKLYEGIEADAENLIFEVRHQILAYASIYEAVIHYVLYEYYSQTSEFHCLQYHIVPTRISIPTEKQAQLNNALSHQGDSIIILVIPIGVRDLVLYPL